MEWCPHSRWLLPPQLNLFGNNLRDTPTCISYVTPNLVTLTMQIIHRAWVCWAVTLSESGSISTPAPVQTEFLSRNKNKLVCPIIETKVHLPQTCLLLRDVEQGETDHHASGGFQGYRASRERGCPDSLPAGVARKGFSLPKCSHFINNVAWRQDV